MEICSNICSLRDAPLSRPYSVSEMVSKLITFRKKKREKNQAKNIENHQNLLAALIMNQ